MNDKGLHTARDMEREIITDFIEIYRKHMLLWKVKSKEYSNKDLKNKGLEKLKEKLKELSCHCTREDVMKRIICFRSAFRRELNESSKNSGNSTEDV